MLRARGISGYLPPVFTLSVFFFLSSCSMKETPPQEVPPPETPPAAEAGKAEVAEAEAGKEVVTEAEAALTAAFSEAEKDGRLVFLHTGADW